MITRVNFTKLDGRRITLDLMDVCNVEDTPEGVVVLYAVLATEKKSFIAGMTYDQVVAELDRGRNLMMPFSQGDEDGEFESGDEWKAGGESDEY